MKLNDLIDEVYGGKHLRRGNRGPIARFNGDDFSLWYYSRQDGRKLFPITFGDMIAENWEVVS